VPAEDHSARVGQAETIAAAQPTRDRGRRYLRTCVGLGYGRNYLYNKQYFIFLVHLC